MGKNENQDPYPNFGSRKVDGFGLNC